MSENPNAVGRRDLRARLAERVLVCDGAMGTMLHAAGASLDRCLPELNITRPDLVSSIHLAYLQAGADIIETNTFGANRVTMERFGLSDQVAAFNAAAVALARATCTDAGSDTLVAGSIAPAAAPRLAARPVDERALDALVEQADALVEAGVDLLVLETFGDLAALVALVGALSVRRHVPVIAQVTFREDGRTISGDSPETVAGMLEDLDVVAIGANCTLGPRGMQRVVEALGRATSLPLSVQPNAGPPMIVRGHFEYRRNEEYFARAAEAFVDLGASIIGGCCGTTPQHIDAVVRHLRQLPTARTGSPAGRHRPVLLKVEEPNAATRISDKLSRGEFILGCEIPAPDGSDPEYAIGEAEALLSAGADALIVTAAPSRASISAVSFGLLLLDRLGIEPILTASTFDKSLVGLQADLLGAHAFGLRTVICTTGTPPPQGDYPDLGGVFTVSSVELIEALQALNDGREHVGTRMRRATAFTIGALADPSAVDFDWELRRTRQKIDAGAEFILTSPVFSLSELERFVEALGHPTVPVLLGVTPLRDFEHAEYLHYEVAGVTIPEDVMRRLSDAGDRSPAVGRQIAEDLARQAVGLVHGVVVRAPDGSHAQSGTLLASLSDLAGATRASPRRPPEALEHR